MDYRTWKEKTEKKCPSVSRKQFEELQKEYGFYIVQEHKKLAKCSVEGVCYTPACKNNYTKQFQTMSVLREEIV